MAHAPNHQRRAPYTGGASLHSMAGPSSMVNQSQNNSIPPGSRSTGAHIPHTHSQPNSQPRASEAGTSVGSSLQRMRGEPSDRLNTYGFLGRRCQASTYAQGGYGPDSVYGRMLGAGVPSQAQNTTASSTSIHGYHRPVFNDAGILPEPPITAGYFTAAIFDVFRFLEKRGGSYNYVSSLGFGDSWLIWPIRNGKFHYELNKEDVWMARLLIHCSLQRDPRAEAQVDKMFDSYIDQAMYDS